MVQIRKWVQDAGVAGILLVGTLIGVLQSESSNRVVRSAADEPRQESNVSGGSGQDAQVPVWLGDARERDRLDSVYVVETHPCGTEHQARAELEDMVAGLFVKHFAHDFPESAVRRLASTPRFSTEQLVFKDRQSILPYEDEATREVARELKLEDTNFFKGYAQLEFTDDLAFEVLKAYHELRLRDRLLNAAAVTTGIFGTLFVAFVFFRLNHATRGIYGGRLAMLAVLFEVALMAALWIGWESLMH